MTPTSPNRWQFLRILLLRDVHFWKATPQRRVGRLFLFGGYAYVGVLLVLLSLENRLLFPGATFGGWQEPAPELGVVDLRLASQDGNTIHAWWIAPAGWKPTNGAVLYSHGNGNNLSSRGGSMYLWRNELGRGALIYDYPGYGKSTGSPTEAGCYAAANAAYDWLVETQQVPAEEVILAGESLGGAMATELAFRRKHRALILVNAFTSFPDMAQKTVPWLPARWLVRNQFDNLRKIPRCPAPIFITHGTADAVVPYSQGERLFAAASEPKKFLCRPGDSHHPPHDQAFFQAVREFLAHNEVK